jgi:hypothetical protein
MISLGDEKIDTRNQPFAKQSVVPVTCHYIQEVAAYLSSRKGHLSKQSQVRGGCILVESAVVYRSIKQIIC